MSKASGGGYITDIETKVSDALNCILDRVKDFSDLRTDNQEIHKNWNNFKK